MNPNTACLDLTYPLCLASNLQAPYEKQHEHSQSCRTTWTRASGLNYFFVTCPLSSSGCEQQSFDPGISWWVFQIWLTSMRRILPMISMTTQHLYINSMSCMPTTGANVSSAARKASTHAHPVPLSLSLCLSLYLPCTHFEIPLEEFFLSNFVARKSRI